MGEAPVSLQMIAAKCIASNLKELTMSQKVQLSESDHEKILVFRDREFVCHKYLSGLLLSALDEKGLIDNSTITLFDPRILPLTDVVIRKGEKVTSAGLQVLQHHQLKSLAIYGLENENVNNVISCLGSWSCKRLSSFRINGSVFSVSGERLSTRPSFLSSFPSRMNFPFLRNGTLGHRHSDSEVSATMDDDTSRTILNADSKFGLGKLTGLRILDVSYTDITTPDLTNICRELKTITNLDLSCCHQLDSIYPLKDLKETLSYLNLHDTQILFKDDCRSVLLSLKNLNFLDISLGKFDLMNRPQFSGRAIACLLNQSNFVPNIKGIDFSGRLCIRRKDLFEFMQARPQLQFLGLMLTSLSSESFVLKPNLVVTGIATVEQVIECMKRYKKRKEYVPKYLYEVFTMTATYDTPQPELIKMILDITNEHPHKLSIQLAATACLYNLTKGYIGDNIHPYLLRLVVEATLRAMKNFPDHSQLQKNALLTLCCDRILHEVNFDKFTCARLVLDALLSFHDPATDRMSVAICSILAANISTDQTAVLGASSAYMKKFLTLVQKKMDIGIVDITLKFTLSALWNLTDESPSTCAVFLNEKGLELFLKLMERFPGVPTVEMKVLGLLNNIAEVSRLRASLINRDFIARLSALLQSDQVEVSYFAAGIIAHLVCAGAECWRDSGISRDDLLIELGEAVLRWRSPEEEMVAYRSFQPFIPLLMALDKPQAQLWAVWALHHVVTKNGSRYCVMLIREGVDEVLRRLMEVPNTDQNVVRLASSVVELLPTTQTGKDVEPL